MLSTHTRLKFHWLTTLSFQLVDNKVEKDEHCELSFKCLKEAFPSGNVMSQAMVKVAQKETDLKPALSMLEREKTPKRNWREAAW